MGLMLLTGGARSGKSALAVRLAAASKEPVTLIATAEPRDEEMAAKIVRHRADRPSDWRVVEEPLELPDAFASSPASHVIVIDCLTLWVANLLELGVDVDEIAARAAAVAKEASARYPLVVVVTNEVGGGIVPADPATRVYRDVMGIVNAVFARVAERVRLVVAGRVLPLGPPEEVLEP